MEESAAKKGVTAVVYDDAGEKYFLIFHRANSWKGWEFAKGHLKDGETPEAATAREVFEAAGLKKFSVKKKLDIQKVYTNKETGEQCVHDVFLVEASMNVPVHIRKDKHDTYQWSKKDLVMARLTHASDRSMFECALDALGVHHV